MENSTESTDVVTDLTNSTNISQNGNKTFLKLMMAVKIFFCVVIIINNVLILLSIRQWKGLSKTSRLLICHLAYSDLLSGVGIIIRTIMVTVYGMFWFTCTIPMGLAAMSGSSSVTGVWFLSLEAFFSARANNVYLSRETYPRAKTAVAVSWLFHLIFISAGVLTHVSAPNIYVCYFGNGYYNRTYLTAFSAMLILHLPLVLGLQISTYRTLTARLGNIVGSHIGLTNGSDNALSTNVQSTAVLTPAVTAKRLLVIKKLTILSILCGIIFIISWGPYACVLFLYSTAPSDRMNVIQPSYLINLGTLTTINSLANIYIYLIRSKEFRRGVRESFGCYSISPAQN